MTLDVSSPSAAEAPPILFNGHATAEAGTVRDCAGRIINGPAIQDADGFWWPRRVCDFQVRKRNGRLQLVDPWDDEDVIYELPRHIEVTSRRELYELGELLNQGYDRIDAIVMWESSRVIRKLDGKLVDPNATPRRRRGRRVWTQPPACLDIPRRDVEYQPHVWLGQPARSIAAE